MRIGFLNLLAVMAALVLSSSAYASEVFTIVIENTPNGCIFVWQDGEAIEIGKVLAPCGAVNADGFTASAWAEDSTVCATAVNAIHLKIASDPETGRGILITLQPREFLDFDPTDYGSYFSQSSSIFTDIPAGTGIFGGPFTPLVGSRFSLQKGQGTGYSGEPSPVPPEYVPSNGDTLVLAVSRNAGIDYIEFDNSFGGLIILKRVSEEPEVIGQVLQPVAGVGRFGGSAYAGVGRIRANHPGVICVSTSPIGQIGGFQIIPSGHAMSPEMTFARTLTQWMVVGPVDARNPSWEGVSPLFYGHLYPSYLPLISDAPGLGGIGALNRLLSRFNVRAKMRGEENWVALPEVTGRDDTALLDLAAIRIYFPLPVKPN